MNIIIIHTAVGEAATKIQASFRGHKVRKEMKTDGSEGGKKAEGEQAELTEKMEELQTNKVCELPVS